MRNYCQRDRKCRNESKIYFSVSDLDQNCLLSLLAISTTTMVDVLGFEDIVLWLGAGLASFLLVVNGGLIACWERTMTRFF